MKQLDDDPFDMGIENSAGKWAQGAWAKCSACGRLKTRIAFSGNQQRFGSVAREGCVCVVNVTVPATEASSTVVETECLTELAKDLAIGPT